MFIIFSKTMIISKNTFPNLFFVSPLFNPIRQCSRGELTLQVRQTVQNETLLYLPNIHPIRMQILSKQIWATILRQQLQYRHKLQYCVIHGETILPLKVRVFYLPRCFIRPNSPLPSNLISFPSLPTSLSPPVFRSRTHNVGWAELGLLGTS